MKESEKIIRMVSICKKMIRCMNRYRTIIRLNQKDGSKISFSSKFNAKSVFEGKNMIGKRCIISGTEIGRMSYLGSDCFLPNVKIGRYCTIASNIKVISARHPTEKFVSVHHVFYSSSGYCGVKYCSENLFDEYETTDKGWNLEIGNDVWICEGVTLLGGIKIGDGAIVATGAVVTKNVQPYSVVGGGAC